MDDKLQTQPIKITHYKIPLHYIQCNWNSYLHVIFRIITVTLSHQALHRSAQFNDL